jgi:hypothetical protein
VWGKRVGLDAEQHRELTAVVVTNLRAYQRVDVMIQPRS